MTTQPWVPGRRPPDPAGATGPAPDPLAPQRRDDWFPGADLSRLTDQVLDAGDRLGSEHVDLRVTNTALAYGSARDARATGQGTDLDAGLAVRVLVAGRWGFAASDVIDDATPAQLVARAVELARASAALGRRRVELAPEPAHRGSWQSRHAVDPFDLSPAERMDLLTARSADLATGGVSHTEAHYLAVRERVHYADSGGAFVQQQRIRVEGEWTAIRSTADGFESMRTLAPPAGRGWEYLAGPTDSVGGAAGWDFAEEIAAMPELLAEKAAAPGVAPGRYQLVLDPTHLWLTIHESVGHATELDRALGYEANYAGTTFATPDGLGTRRYGSPLMNVTGDRFAPHGLATVAVDDEGVAAQRWDIVADGVHVDYQLDRAMAARLGRPRSNGCAYADSFGHIPIQRMPNVSLQPDPGGLDLAGLIEGVDRGLLILGDNSWSIDMQRFNFQFTGQRAHLIEDGRVRGQVRDFAYQSSTPDFWRSLSALGGPGTYLLGGAFNCGKGQPGQVAAVSHGSPAAVFDDVRVLNTREEAGA